MLRRIRCASSTRTLQADCGLTWPRMAVTVRGHWFASTGWLDGDHSGTLPSRVLPVNNVDVIHHRHQRFVCFEGPEIRQVLALCEAPKDARRTLERHLESREVCRPSWLVEYGELAGFR